MMSAGYLTGGRGKQRYQLMTNGPMMRGGKGKPFTKKNVFGKIRMKALHGPAGYGRVHYASRLNMKAKFSNRQNAHNQFTKQFIQSLPKPGSRAGARANMAAAQRAWVAQNGRVVMVPQIVKG
jgi:hypothetical protein